MNVTPPPAAAVRLLGSLLLDLYFWRCVYDDGAATAATALAALLRHEAVFAGCSSTSIGGGGNGGVTAADLAADVARWLQPYHSALLRFPEVGRRRGTEWNGCKFVNEFFLMGSGMNPPALQTCHELISPFILLLQLPLDDGTSLVSNVQPPFPPSLHI